MKSLNDQGHAIESDNFLIVDSTALHGRGRDSIIINKRLVGQRQHCLYLLTTGNRFHQITIEQSESIIIEPIKEQADYLDLLEEIIRGQIFMVFRLAIKVFELLR